MNNMSKQGSSSRCIVFDHTESLSSRSEQVCLESLDLLHTHLALAGKRFDYWYYYYKEPASIPSNTWPIIVSCLVQCLAPGHAVANSVDIFPTVLLPAIVSCCLVKAALHRQFIYALPEHKAVQHATFRQLCLCTACCSLMNITVSTLYSTAVMAMLILTLV